MKRLVTGHSQGPQWRFNVHERIQGAEKHDDSTQPDVNQSISGSLLRLLKLRMMKETDAELGKAECHNDQADNLMVVAESPRLKSR